MVHLCLSEYDCLSRARLGVEIEGVRLLSQGSGVVRLVPQGSGVSSPVAKG
jgi:hypothetical protein